MKDKKWYDVTVDKARTEKERQKARKLRESRWWQEKLKEGVCYYCKKTFPKDKLTMDHIVPIARGGRSTKRCVLGGVDSLTLTIYTASRTTCGR